jgi:hypothetical protein
LKYPWALILDADERVPKELAREIADRTANPASDVAAFRIRRRFHLWGKWLRHSSFYPTWLVRLIRVGRVQYVNRGHAETQIVDGRIDTLQHDLIDENHKGLSDWWERQNRYTTQEALYELQRPAPALSDLFSSDPLRRRPAFKALVHMIPGRPLWFFLYAYLIRLGFLDGIDGFRYCCMNTIREIMTELKKHEMRRLRALPSQESHELGPIGSYR